jgi:hypothetical protein
MYFIMFNKFTFSQKEREIDEIVQEHLDDPASKDEEVHSAGRSVGEYSADLHNTNVLYTSPQDIQHSEVSPRSPAPSPRDILTSQQSIVSGRFTRTSVTSGDTGNQNTPTRCSPIQMNAVEAEEIQDRIHDSNVCNTVFSNYTCV